MDNNKKIKENNIKIIKNSENKKKRGRPAGSKNKNKTDNIFIIQEIKKINKLNRKLLKQNIILKERISFYENNKIIKLLKKIFY